MTLAGVDVKTQVGREVVGAPPTRGRHHRDGPPVRKSSCGDCTPRNGLFPRWVCLSKFGKTRDF